MARYGWILNVERCAYLDDPADPSVQHYNINLVRPWTDDLPGDPRGPQIDDAKNSLGTLLYPWLWSGITWQFFGTADRITWVPILTGADELKFVEGVEELEEGSALDLMRKGITAELDAMTAHCKYPFSVDVQDYWGREDQNTKVTLRSHVHAMAPLSHWPAQASEIVLSLTRFIRVKTAALVGFTDIACVPEFKFERTSPAPDLSGAVIGVATQGVRIAPDKVQVIANYVTADVGFACLTAATGGVAVAAPKLQLRSSQGFISRTALRSIVVGHVLPLSLSHKWMSALIDRIAQDPLIQKKEKPVDTEILAAVALLSDSAMWDGMQNLLWRSIGSGAEFRGKAGASPNVVEWLLPYASAQLAVPLRRALNTTTTTPAQAKSSLGMALDGVVDVWPGLARLPVSNSWTETSRSRWKRFNELRVKGHDSIDINLLLDSWRTWAEMASTLISDDGAMELLGPWLSFIHESSVNSGGLGAVWRDTISPALRGGKLRRDHLARARAALVTSSQWSAIQDSDLEPGVTVDRMAMKSESLVAIKSLVGAPCAALISGAQIGASALDQQVERVIASMDAALTRAGEGARPRARDRGIRLSFAAAEDGMDADALKAWDNRIRGYAIGLCGGVLTGGAKWQPDKARAAWITDTALLVHRGAGIHWIELKSGGSKPTAWMHDTVGATSSNGERTLAIEYDGFPASTALADKDKGTVFPKNDGIVDDGFNVIDFGWPQQLRPLPLMAYGAGYHAVASALDNCGAAVFEGYRATSVATLKKASGLDEFKADTANPLRYLSSEPPGSPRVLSDVDPFAFELSEDTQAHAHQSQAGQTVSAKPVALLGFRQTPDVLLSSVKSSIDIEWTAPAVHPEFFRRWVQADLMIRELNSADDLLSDAAFRGRSGSQIETFINEMLVVDERTGRAAHTPYNPAVSAVGLQIFDPINKFTENRVIPLQRAVFDGTKLKPAFTRVQCSVVSAAKDASLSVSPVAGDRIVVTVPQGRFVRIRAFSLVEASFFDSSLGSHCRLSTGIELKGAEDPGFAGFKSFGPIEHWIEVMPAWLDGALQESQVKLAFEGPAPAGAKDHSPNLALLHAEFTSGPWVGWTKGLLLQRHEWHWTGYPVELPRVDDLGPWLVSLAGVESFREAIDVTLATSFDGSSKWTLGTSGGNKQVVHQLRLAQGTRPSKYGAYFARPLLRFRKWLKADPAGTGPRKLEQFVFAVGGILRGRGIPNGSERIGTPALRWAVPLTSSYGSNEQGNTQSGFGSNFRRPNGCLLVFDEAIRRTDDSAHVGGIGDTVEIDLLETRISGFNEIGPNPIFHGKGAGAIGLDAGIPFGLTFDIGPNPKVAQTGIVVTPTGASGRWTMAKVRTRRLLLPEVELGNELRKARGDTDLVAAVDKLSITDRDALAKLTGEVFYLPTRTQGEEIVPLDFAIDLSNLDISVISQVSIVVGSGKYAQKLDLDIPAYSTSGPLKPDPTTAKIRLLVSWHKGRWVPAEDPSWRAQVLLQRQRGGTLAWDPGSEQPKTSCHKSAASQLPRRLGDSQLWVFTSKSAKSTEASRVRMSDYSDPIWMSFVGNFGQEKLGLGSDYTLQPANGNASLRLIPRRPDVVLPQLRALDLAEPDPTFHLALLFRPMSDVTRGAPEVGTGGLVSVYVATGVDQGLKHLRLTRSQPPGAPDPTGCHAYVVTLQRTTGLSTAERQSLKQIDPSATTSGWASFDDLLTLSFPNLRDGRSVESLLRFLPEYLGPVDVQT